MSLIYKYIIRPVSAVLIPTLTIAAFLFLLVAVLSATGYGRTIKDGHRPTFNQGVTNILTVVWEGSILPSPPPKFPPRPGVIRLQSYRSWMQMLNSATPLILTGLAVMLAFKANVLNIGSEGQFITGAIGGFTVGYYGATHFPNLPALPMLSVLLLAGFVSGAIPALIAGLMQQYRHVPVVLSTILMNFACAILLKALLQGPLHQQQEGLASEALPEIALLPHITIHGTATFLHYGFFIAIALAMLLFLIFKFTVFGFKLRITGENPTAAKFAGIRVSSVMLICLCLSGGVAGMAGAIQISGNSSYQLLPSTASLGLGFAGIAVALLGRLSPIAIIPAAIFFGWLNVAFAALQTKLEVPSLALQAVQGSIMIMLLIVGRLQKRTA